jgi:hypothetical protein
MKKQRFESVVSGFSGSKNLLELLRIKNVNEISFLCSLGGAWGTGRFGFGQEFELSANAKKRDRVFCDFGFEHTDQALIFGVAPRGCVWALAAYHSILMRAEDEDALLIRPRSGKSVRSIPSKISCWVGARAAKSRARRS